MIRFGLMTFPGLVNEVLMGKLGILSLMFCTIVLLSCGKKKNVYSELELLSEKKLSFPIKTLIRLVIRLLKTNFY